MGNAEALAALQATVPKSNPNPVVTATPGNAGVTPTGEPGTAPANELESTRFNHLAKKEAELQRSREAFKSEQTQFMTERQKFVEIQKQLTQFNEMKVKDPVAALKMIGFSEKDLFNFVAAQEDTSTPEQRAARAANSEIQKFKDEQAKQAAAVQEEQNKQVLTQFRGQIASTIKSDPDKFEYCNYHGEVAQDLIEETVSAVLQADKELISVAEATEMVEQYYEEQDKAMNSLKKRQPKEAAAPAPTKDEPLKPQVSPRPSAGRTLSNKTVATVASTTVQRKETPGEKRQRLIDKLGSLGKQ